MQNERACSRQDTGLAKFVLLGMLNTACASSIYWPQAVIGPLQASLGDPQTIGLAPSAALTGYAIGVATLAIAVRELSDRRGLLAHAAILACGLGIVVVAPTASVAVAGSLVIGSGCAVTQRMLIIATTMTTPERRADAIGLLLGTGLTGIVVARAFVGELAAALGWRELFVAQACAVAGIAAMLAVILPAPQANRGARPPAITTLWHRHPTLRRAAMGQAAAFGAYNAGWALLPKLAHTAPSMRAVIAGIGAIAAVAAGRATRRAGATRMARLAALPILVAAGAALTIREPGVLICAMMLVEIGTQLSLVSNQARAQATAPDLGTRGRMATVVTTVGFAGGALGAAVANLLTR